MKPKKLSEEQIGNIVSLAVREAVDFIESEIAPDRIRSQKYFDGKSTIGHDEGRSKVVATKCRDTIRAIKPALMRVFLQSDKPVEFQPTRPDAVDAAEQATKYAAYVFRKNDGFNVLSDVFHDALIKKVGIAKVYYDEVDDVEIDEYSGLSEDAIALIQGDDEVEVLEQEIEVEAEMGPDGAMISPAVYSARVARTNSRGQIKVESVAPEDFFVDSDAVGIKDCYVCGHSSEGRVGDLVAMGFDFDEVYELSGDAEGRVSGEENIARRGYDDDQEANIDPSMRKVLITEAYMKMDIEGVGVPRMYKFLCAGEGHKVLDYELCDYNPFAVFEVDPEPHTFFGRSLVDIITDDQDAATSLLRGLLDNIAMINNPSVAVNSQGADNDTYDDLLNNEIGRIIRTKGDPRGALYEFTVGNAANAALPAMQFYDEAIRAKTGVSGASMGMDADALQSQTATGVNAAVQAAAAVSELIARTLAEGGMTQLFRTIAQIARQNPNEDEMMQIDGQFIPVDPRSWTADMDMVTNVGLGNNKYEERMMTLQQVLQLQMQVFGTYGPTNGMVTMTNIRNTAADIMSLGGLPNSNRYMQPMNPQREAMLLQQSQQAAAAQAQGSDPNAAFMQAEMGKAQIKAQTDLQKATMEHQRKILEMANSDDLERDQMAQDLLVDAAKILGEYGTTVDVARVKAEQAAPRDMMGGYNG